ncbi:MAG: anaerobic ribonucleoside-triphosphate reductase activating protein [Chloroflexi bacterium]|nr:anaerobic ribonucleoside-triphosphate reductase activating protein [Chloroflexota bacterium]
MRLKGWVRTSLIDYPDHIATILFTGGCNFRCPSCHNADLVLRPAEMPDLPLEEVWGFLSRRAGLVDGVVVTGGEPTLQNGLIPFLRQVRERGFDVKLDTNGYRPDVLAALLDENLVDYVAMDIKAQPDTYPLLAGYAELDVARLERSIALLQNSDISHEFRTTVVPGLLDKVDVDEIARWIAGAERYVLQQFRPLGTLDPAMGAVTPYPLEKLQAMAERASRWVIQATVRGGG